ncbi:MAG: aldo/keto reductase [Candidatus Omnitrophota bacterium]
MEYRKLGTSELEVSVISLGTWAFGGDNWWGKQDDRDSVETLDCVINSGINFIDTAPIYGKGRSEKIIGAFLSKKNLRQKVLISTKAGLSWQGPKIIHDLSKKRILEELDESRSRLRTDYFDLYQAHWPDKNTPIGETAEVFDKLFKNRVIKSVGVSNFSIEQIAEFMKYCPLHSLQPPYSMFNREIESKIVPFCLKNNIGIISYASLYSGILTGKFFFDNIKIPDDTNRKMKKADLEEPGFSINRKILISLKDIALSYGKSLAQLAINWNFSQKSIASSIVGARNKIQADENSKSYGFQISEGDMHTINEILTERDSQLAVLKK